MRKNLVKKHWLLKEQTSNSTKQPQVLLANASSLKKKKKSPQNTQVADMQ